MTYLDWFLHTNRETTKDDGRRLLYTVYALTRTGKLWNTPIEEIAPKKLTKLTKRHLIKALG